MPVLNLSSGLTATPGKNNTSYNVISTEGEKMSTVALDPQVSDALGALAGRTIDHVFFVACGGSLSIMHPAKFMLDQASASLPSDVLNAAEFIARAPRRLRIPRHPFGPVVLWPRRAFFFPLDCNDCPSFSDHHNNSYSNVVDASMRLSRWDRACVGPRALFPGDGAFPIHDRF